MFSLTLRLVSSFDGKSTNEDLPEKKLLPPIMQLLLSSQKAQIFTDIQIIPIKIHNEVLSLTGRMKLQPFLLQQIKKQSMVESRKPLKREKLDKNRESPSSLSISD